MNITYRFLIDYDRVETFELLFHPETMELVRPRHDDAPAWTKLDCHKCGGCPLDSKESPYCPLAASIADLVERFDGLHSHEKLNVEIVSPGRNFMANTSVQRSVSSLMGLIIPTCGCPKTAFFRPMARNHLPLSDAEETTYRAVGMYLLGQFMKQRQGGEPDYSLEGLKEIYRGMEVVNVNIARRLRLASETDSSLNAIVLLDVFAKTLPFAIDDGLVEMQNLFTAYFD